MFALKTSSSKHNRRIGVALLAGSFTIQMVPPILHAWARVLGLSDGGAMAGIAVVYLVLLAVVLSKGPRTKA